MATDVIILNRMYVGDYLGDNIGHEVINLMKPDNKNNNNYYIYINARGDLNDEFIQNKWKAKTILLTRWCSREYKEEGMKNTKKQSFLEVLAMIGSTDSKDKMYIQPWTLEDTIKKEQELIKKTIYEDFKNFNDKFHSNIILEEKDNISDILQIQKVYEKISSGLQKIYKQQNIPIAIYNINNIIKNISKSNKTEKAFELELAQKEQDKLNKEDKDKTGKYKKIEKKKIVCTKKEVEGYKRYLYELEEYYNKPLQKLQHKLQVISLEGVTYGDKALQDIFAKNIRNDRALYVTFTAKNIKMVKPGYHIYLIGDNINKKENDKIKFINVIVDENNNVVTEKLNFSRQSLRQYIHNDKYQDVYNNILTQLNNLDEVFWEEQPPLTFDDRKNLEDKDPHHIDVTPQKANFIDIIRKNYDELIYSNLFYHIFKSKPKLFYEFATSEKGLNISHDKLSTNCKETLFLREDGNIDLLIDDKDKKTLIVIENKIKSGINGIRYNELDKECGNQLSKYIHYTYGYKVKKGTDKSGYEYEQFSEQENEIKPYKDYEHREFFIFAPRYKNFDIETINGNLKKENTKDEYQLITYDKIYDFFNNQDIKNKYSSIPYYEEFLYAIKNHKYESDNIQERQMFERFAERIKEL